MEIQCQIFKWHLKNVFFSPRDKIKAKDTLCFVNRLAERTAAVFVYGHLYFMFV